MVSFGVMMFPCSTIDLATLYRSPTYVINVIAHVQVVTMPDTAT